MILEIRRREADGNPLYEVLEEGQVQYMAKATRNQKKSDEEYVVAEPDSGEEGHISFRQHGSRTVIERGGIEMCGYLQYDGAREVVSFYVGKIQVGQMVRPLAAESEDFYWIHMLDLYTSWLWILGEFTAIYDERRRRKGSDVQKSANLMQVLESAQNQELYHRDFVENYFGSEESLRLDAILDSSEKRIRSGMAGEVRHVGRWLILGWAVVTAVFLAILWFAGL